MRKSMFIMGTFLIAIGSIFLTLGLLYAMTYGISTDIPIEYLLFPEVSGNLLWLISVSSSMIVLGIIFILWAYKIPNQQKQKSGDGKYTNR